MDFREADRRYAELRRQLDTGTINDEEFDDQRRQLMVQDDKGRWWAKSRKTGQWNYRDGDAWIPGTPPDYQRGISEPTTTTNSPAQASSSPRQTEGGEKGRNRGKRMPLWIIVSGLGGVALVGIVLVVWVLVPYLQGGAVSEGSTSTSAKQGKSAAPNSSAIDAAFVHHATSENISANSTYLDNALINGDPNVILYVTQSWNPGGGSGTYNDHPIGVWYDADTQRWAIFNQDRGTMPEGAAFNVAVLKKSSAESG